MSDKARPVQSGTGSRPEKRRLRAGATGLLLTSKNLAQAPAGEPSGNDGQTQKRPRDVRGIFVSH